MSDRGRGGYRGRNNRGYRGSRGRGDYGHEGGGRGRVGMGDRRDDRPRDDHRPDRREEERQHVVPREPRDTVGKDGLSPAVAGPNDMTPAGPRQTQRPQKQNSHSQNKNKTKETLRK